MLEGRPGLAQCPHRWCVSIGGLVPSTPHIYSGHCGLEGRRPAHEGPVGPPSSPHAVVLEVDPTESDRSPAEGWVRSAKAGVGTARREKALFVRRNLKQKHSTGISLDCLTRFSWSGEECLLLTIREAMQPRLSPEASTG